MLFYNSDGFYAIFLSRHAIALYLRRTVPHAITFSLLSILAPVMVHLGWLDTSHSELISTLSFILAFILSFRLQYGLSVYHEALTVVVSLQSASKCFLMRSLAYVSAEDDKGVESMRTCRRLLTLLLLLVRARVRTHNTARESDADAVILHDEELLQSLRGIGILTTDELLSLTNPCRVCGSQSDRTGRFPSKSRTQYVLHLLFAEVNSLHKQQLLGSTNHWATLDHSVGELQGLVGSLDALLTRLLPFAYAHFIKSIIVLYLLIFPYSVAVELMWLTPLGTFGAAMVILAIDRAGTLMLRPFSSDMRFGIDIDKRIRRTDRELASLLGTWRGRPQTHFDLFPETKKRRLCATGARSFHRTVLDRSCCEKELQTDMVHAGPQLPKTPAGPHAALLRRISSRTMRALSRARSPAGVQRSSGPPLPPELTVTVERSTASEPAELITSSSLSSVREEREEGQSAIFAS